MLTQLKSFFKRTTSDLNQEFEETQREEFERQAFASGDFKGVRFTRLKAGDYADAGLDAAWREWLELQELAARQF